MSRPRVCDARFRRAARFALAAVCRGASAQRHRQDRRHLRRDRPGLLPGRAGGEDRGDAGGEDQRRGRRPGPEDRAGRQGLRRQPGEGHLLRQAAHRGGEGPGHHRPVHQRRDDGDQEHLPGRPRRSWSPAPRPRRSSTRWPATSSRPRRRTATRRGWIYRDDEGQGHHQDRRRRQQRRLRRRRARSSSRSSPRSTASRSPSPRSTTRQATDLTDVLTKVKGQDVQAVVNWSIVPAQSLVAKNMKQIGLNVPLFQSHGFGNIKYVAGRRRGGRRHRLPLRAAAGGGRPAGRPSAEGAARGVQEGLREPGTRRTSAPSAATPTTRCSILAEAIKKAGTAGPARRSATPSRTSRASSGTAGVFNFSADGPQRPGPGRLRDADGQGRQVRDATRSRSSPTVAQELSRMNLAADRAVWPRRASPSAASTPSWPSASTSSTAPPASSTSPRASS